MIWNRRKPNNPETANTSAQSAESPQLSQVKGVPTDMSSMAIGGAFPNSSGVRGGQQLRFADPATLAGMDDAQVMLRVREGDDAAFNYLVERYRRAMMGFMYRMVHNAAIAEELSQEVFLRVYRSRSSYSADAKFTKIGRASCRERVSVTV
jgi:RNA polymerase sigma-70 factor (ECF subfamily)